MILSDEEKGKIKGEIFDLIKEAHVRLWQENDNIMPGWARAANALKRAAVTVDPSRIGEVMDSPRIARERNEGKAAKPKKVSTKKEKPPTSHKDDLIKKAKDMGLKVDGRMSEKTIEDKINEQG